MGKPEVLRSSPQIPYQEIRLLWFCDYWDGPLSGVCFYWGQRYWFEAIEPEKDNYGYPRTMGVYILSAEDLQSEEESQRRFQQYVGMHTTYDDPENCSVEEPPRSGEDREKFYSWSKQQPKRDYRHNEMVGWFEV
ncbi:hypothetical protein KDW_40480 [Dictyobacter vulcani]|uniref:Uncharacterized protein n=2 Tax=Dictyobacter vulcani TaxID=2607529 RepID=A0A5J4KXG8_9CHLR|nr:hypothetical protein KDW_40480 [Dictyobacter vulcani]